MENAARKFGGMLLLAALAVSCNAPQIPLPPPSFKSYQVELSATPGEVRIQGTVPLAGGQVFLIDTLTGDGIVRHVDATGAFDTGFFPARDGQHFSFRYGDGVNESDVSCMEVRYSPAAVTNCP